VERGLGRGGNTGDAVSVRADLAERFKAAPCPTTLRQLAGPWDSAVIGLDGWQPPRFVRHLAPRGGLRLGIPWLGVVVHAEGAYDGRGASRIWTPLGERQLMPFAVRLEASRLDGRPCVLFDYADGSPEGPLPRRHDELRLAPGGAELVGVGFVTWRSAPRALFWYRLAPATQAG
jgi:hypothetical protein